MGAERCGHLCPECDCDGVHEPTRANTIREVIEELRSMPFSFDPQRAATDLTQTYESVLRHSASAPKEKP